MVKVRSEKESARRKAESAIHNLALGKQSENWALGEIEYSGVRNKELKDLFSSAFDKYDNITQIRQLQEVCTKKGWMH